MRTASRTRPAHRLLHVGYVVAALVIGVAGFGTTTYAQEKARVNIDFTFVAAGKEMPAGTYEFEVTHGGVVLRPPNVKMSLITMPVLTRLGRHDADPDPELVFDKVLGKPHLSELWLPNEDGYLLLNTPADHEHRVLGGSRPHK
jgi:hypothetical protein